MPKVFLDPVMQELRLQTLSVWVQPLVPPAIQHWPRLASLGSCSSSGPWKYLLLVVLSFHFISFLLTLNIDIFEGKGTFKCMNYRLILSRIPQFVSQILSLALVYGSKIYTTLSVSSSLVHFPTACSMWSIPNIL